MVYRFGYPFKAGYQRNTLDLFNLINETKKSKYIRASISPQKQLYRNPRISRSDPFPGDSGPAALNRTGSAAEPSPVIPYFGGDVAA